RAGRAVAARADAETALAISVAAQHGPEALARLHAELLRAITRTAPRTARPRRCSRPARPVRSATPRRRHAAFAPAARFAPPAPGAASARRGTRTATDDPYPTLRSLREGSTELL